MDPPPRVDRAARDEAIRRIERLLAGEKALDLSSIRRARGRDKDLDLLFDDFDRMVASDLPSKPRGTGLSAGLRREMERTVLFLRTDVPFRDPHAAPPSQWIPLLIAAVGGVVCLVAAAVTKGQMDPRFNRALLTAGGIGVAIAFAWMVVLPYALFLTAATIHIFRVRILQQDLDERSRESPDDHWPFATREQYEQVRDVRRTEST